MNRRPRRRFKGLVLTLALAGLPAPSFAADIVYDPLNYKQNLASALRALQSVNNQVQQLQNEAQMLIRMDRHLAPIGQSASPRLQASLNQLAATLAEGEAVALSVAETQTALARLYPNEFGALTSDAAVSAARERWAEALAAFKRNAMTQAQIVEAIAADASLLDSLLLQSKAAEGSLQAAQTGNELTGLSIKQSLQTQALLAAAARAETSARARDLVTQEEARQRFQTFLGTASAYADRR
ncbi:MAG: P-type conjugative transfer protein TrbJ [Hyphomicrobiales bacterium]|nr:P-type conjugative transfer protein TrbJ [Hyphomicrobiales bacterium]